MPASNFVFAGEVYSRSYGEPSSQWPEWGAAAAAAVFTAAALALALRLHLRDSHGVPKLTAGGLRLFSGADEENEESLDGLLDAPAAGKGIDTDRLGLASQLKTLSASISAARAAEEPTDGSGSFRIMSAAKSSEKGRKVLVQEAIVLLRKLADADVMKFRNQQILEAVRDDLQALHERGYRKIGQSVKVLFAHVKEVDAQSPISGSTLEYFMTLHLKLLQIHQDEIESHEVESVARDLKNVIRQSPTLEREFGDALANLQNLDSVRLLHQLLLLSRRIALFDPEDPQTLSAKTQSESVSSLVDILMASKVLLLVCKSLQEIDILVEGFAMKKLVEHLRKTISFIWPDYLRDSEQGINVFQPLLLLHILTRKEQYRRMRVSTHSVHDNAVWKHCLNVTAELSQLALAKPAELEFSSEMINLLTGLRNLITILGNRVEECGKGKVLCGDDDIAYSELIMDPELVYRKTEFKHEPSFLLLQHLQSDDKVVNAIHLHVSRVVETLLTCSYTCICVGDREKSRFHTCGKPEESDVILCLTFGNSDRTCEQFTFLRTSVPPETHEVLFKAMEAIKFENCLLELEALPEVSENERETMELHDFVVANFAGLSEASVGELPQRFKSQIDACGSNLHRPQALSILHNEIGSSADDVGLFLDQAQLKLENISSPFGFVRYFAPERMPRPGTPLYMIVCILYPNFAGVCCQNKQSANVALRKLLK